MRLLRLFGFAVLFGLLSACGAATHGFTGKPSPTSISRPTPTATAPPIRVEVTWVYADAQRLGLELRVHGYPLPLVLQQSDVFVPISAVDLVAGGRRVPLFRNETSGRVAFIAPLRHARFYVAKEWQNSSQSNFLLSFAFLRNGGEPLPAHISVRVELGEFHIKTASGVITLPAQGVFTLPVDLPTKAEPRRSFGPLPPVQAEGLTAELEHVFINPSVTWVDACLRYPDHHLWLPTAELRVDGHPAVYSEGGLYLFPFSPQSTEVIRAQTRRCFDFTLPFVFPQGYAKPIHVGISRVVISNADSNFLTMEECEAAKQKVEAALPDVTLRCITFELRGHRQVWFDIVSFPPSLTREEVYNAMLKALTINLTHGWYWDIYP